MVIIASLLGGNRVLSLDSTIATNFILESSKGKGCCFIHHLIKMEEVSELKNKFRLTSFINYKLLSKELMSFLCELLSNKAKKTELKKLRAHPWFRTPRFHNTKVYLKEIIKIVKDLKKPNCLIRNDNALNNFMTSLSIIMTNNKESKNSPFLSKLLDPNENVKQLLETKKRFLKEVAVEINVSYPNLVDKIVNLIAEIKSDKICLK